MSGVHDSPANSPAPTNDGGYPEQKHAGAVGYGPEYGKRASAGDKLTGYKEEVKGKLFHKPDLVEHGRELRTGELKKKQQEQDDMDPFNQSGGGQKDEPQSAGAGAGGPDRPSSLTDTTHPTEKGAREQAAATAPEGTEKAHRQQTQGNTDKVSYIG